MSAIITTRKLFNVQVRRFSTKAGGERVFLVAGKRTPFGKFGGTLMDVKPVELSLCASKSLLEETGVKASQLDHVIFANVCPVTTDTMYGARHLALKLGAPIQTPAYSVNRLCGSGIQAIVEATHMIQRGEASCVLASGSENMSLSPHLVYGSRFGTRYGPLKTVDMLTDALEDAYCKTPMAITAENLAEKFKVTRDEADEFSLKSHQKAAAAYKNQKLQGEITPVGKDYIRKGECTMDEHMRPNATIEEMKKLNATFKKGGVVTAATASGVVDGAASVIVASESFVKKNNLTPLAQIIDYVAVGVEPTLMGIGPSPAIRSLLAKTGLDLKQIDLFEINEAFAAQAIAVAKDLGLDTTKLNIWGGATAIGHPLGATGVRISLTLARQMKDTGAKTGIASACIGGGQGIALLLKSVN